MSAWLDRSTLGISTTERALYADVFRGLREPRVRGRTLRRAATRLHDALVEFRDQTMTNAVLDRIREVYPLIGLREYLPDELGHHGLDVAMVDAPVFDAGAGRSTTSPRHPRARCRAREIVRLGHEVRVPRRAHRWAPPR